MPGTGGKAYAYDGAGANTQIIAGRFLPNVANTAASANEEGEMNRFTSKLDAFGGDDSRKLDNEKLFIMRKIDEVQNEIFQLENNIQFFQNSKNNPIVNEVKKNIERHKEELLTWKDKLKHINALIKQNKESAE